MVPLCCQTPQCFVPRTHTCLFPKKTSGRSMLSEENYQYNISVNVLLQCYQCNQTCSCFPLLSRSQYLIVDSSTPATLPKSESSNLIIRHRSCYVPHQNSLRMMPCASRQWPALCLNAIHWHLRFRCSSGAFAIPIQFVWCQNPS